MAIHSAQESFEISSPKEKILGQGIGDWTDDWWTWALQSSLERNPLFDTTGADADENNDGPVFFLAGTLSNDPVERTFEIPDDTPVLVPLMNNFINKFDGEPQPQKIINDELRDWQDTVLEDELFLVIDGVEIKNLDEFFFKSGFFTPGQPEDGSLLEAVLAGEEDYVSGDDLFPSRSAGYWVMIEDLDPGAHTIHYGGQTSTGQVVDVTSDILII